jgi:PAS domain-containing protein
VAVFLLHESENEIERNNRNDARILSYELEEILENSESGDMLTNVRGRLNLTVSRLRDEMGDKAVYLSQDGKEITFGTQGNNDDVHSRTITYYPHGQKKSKNVLFSAYFPNRKTVVEEMRKHMLLSIGASIFVFGFLLQRVLQKVLTVPFVNMVRAAEDFSLGNEEARFDGKRQDEFGYLGGFINNALDSIMEQQGELVNALERASQSEVALNIEKERAEVTLYSIADSVITVDTAGHVQFINPAAEKLLAISNEDAAGRPYNELVKVVVDSAEVLERDLLLECFQTGRIVQFPDHASIINNDTALIAVEASIAPMRSES